MIQMQTELTVADNTGARIVECIKVLGGSKRRFAGVGDVIVVSVKDAIPAASVKAGQIFKAVVVRTKAKVRRADGSNIRSDENSVVLLNNSGELIGTRFFGVAFSELRRANFLKILSLAPEVY